MAFGNLNVPISFEIVILLLLIGAAIKNLEVFQKVVNNYIPVILIVIGVAVALLTDVNGLPANLVDDLIKGLASAILAVGIHSSGKNIFVNGVFVNFFVKQNFGEDLEENTDKVPGDTSKDTEEKKE